MSSRNAATAESIEQSEEDIGPFPTAIKNNPGANDRPPPWWTVVPPKPQEDSPTSALRNKTTTSEVDEENKPPEPRILVHKQSSSPMPRTQLLQQWEGTVENVLDDKLSVRLRDLTQSDGPEEMATIELDAVPEADIKLVEPGAVFYWSIGYRVEPHGQKTLRSDIRFRRLPAWTASEIARAETFAKKYDQFFK